MGLSRSEAPGPMPTRARLRRHPSSARTRAAAIALGAAWFAAAVGVFASSVARNSTRALTATFLALLLLLNFWPFAMAGALFSPREFAALGAQV